MRRWASLQRIKGLAEVGAPTAYNIETPLTETCPAFTRLYHNYLHGRENQLFELFWLEKAEAT